MGTPEPPSSAPGDAVASSRVRFLTAEPVDPDRVRGSILASWRRSRDLHVAADHVEQPYTRDPDTDTPLTRTAEPVLRSLLGQLDGQPMSVILTDHTGLVLSRQTGDSELDRYLDRVLLAPGFSYAEQFVGTNGIGTALEVGGPTHVFGHEHYAENLEELACAGVPIRHPISGRTVGAIDLTCWARDAGPLLLTLAKTTAEQIRQALLAGAAAQHLELVQEYMRTCRRMPGIVLALSGDMVMLNDHARAVLDPFDQAALIAQAGEARADGHRGPVLAELPSGRRVRMHSRTVGGPQSSGLVVHAKLVESAALKIVRHEATPRMPLPGLVGTAPMWLRACDEVETAFRSGEWLAVAGEPAVGKLAMLRAVQLRRQPVGRLVVVDGADADTDARWSTSLRRALNEGAESVVVQHLDRLEAGRLRDLAAALVDARGADRGNRLWVAVTLGPATTSKGLTEVLRLFPSTVEVPPLRLHTEDLQQLVPFFLGRLGQAEHLVCSAEAMKVLMRGTWPGNAGQVLTMLREIVKLRRSGSIQPQDLPPGVQTVSRRRLSQLESLERDAVVHALLDARGDKSKAASSLGVSRATIYRKIHEYGVVSAPAERAGRRPRGDG